MKVLLTGSSGRIGAAIGARLALRHRVIGVDRRRGPLTTSVVDIRDTTRIAVLCRGVDAIVHTAALHVPDLAGHAPAEFHSVNVDATRRLLQAAGEGGARRFVYTSTTSLYGDAMLPHDGAATWVTEALTPRPRDVYDETKLAAEEACRAAAGAGMSCVSLRMSRCFPEDARLVAIYRLYRGVDADDVAQAHELALTADLPAFETFNVSARPPFEAADCHALFTDAESLLTGRIPWIRAEFARRGWQLPRSIDRVYVVDKAMERLGYRPVHDFASLFSRQGGMPAQGS